MNWVKPTDAAAPTTSTEDLQADILQAKLQTTIQCYGPNVMKRSTVQPKLTHDLHCPLACRTDVQSQEGIDRAINQKEF